MGKMNNRQKGIIAGLTASAIWGGMYVVSKVVLEIVPPLTLLTVRLVLGIATLGIAAMIGRISHRISREQLVTILLVGMLGYGLSLGLQFAGTELSTAANGAVLTASTPALVFGFAGFLLGEGLTVVRILALAVSTLGVLAIVDPARSHLNESLLLGNLLLVGAAITWALYSVLVRLTSRRTDTLLFTLIALCGGLVLAIPAAAWELRSAQVAAVSAGTLAGIIYLGIVSTAVAAYLWNKAFALLEAGTASLTFFAQPLVGAGLGALFLNEELSWLFFIGATLILVGLFIAARDDTITREISRKKIC